MPGLDDAHPVGVGRRRVPVVLGYARLKPVNKVRPLRGGNQGIVWSNAHLTGI